MTATIAIIATIDSGGAISQPPPPLGVAVAAVAYRDSHYRHNLGLSRRRLAVDATAAINHPQIGGRKQ
ncbi:MAG: hypothetical protein ABSA05_09700 [Opitutaceae bacterium]|jgi:hypothetical protein